jgi:RNA-directed DNA polymerase
VIDLDLRAYFDTVRHDLLLGKVARRIDDDDVMRLLKLMLTASGKQGVPQGGVISPLLSNIYLTEVDRMLERAKTVTSDGPYTAIEYARLLTIWWSSSMLIHGMRGCDRRCPRG